MSHAPTIESLTATEDLSRSKLAWKCDGPFAHIECQKGKDSLWMVISRKGSQIALRLIHLWGAEFDYCLDKIENDVVEVQGSSSLGSFRGRLDVEQDPFCIRWQFWLTPMDDLKLSPSPRDLYPLGELDGVVHAAQRGLNTGLLYFSCEGGFGDVLYLQDFTSIQEFFVSTSTSPDTTVGGEWPELGYRRPYKDDARLKKGQEIQLLDTKVAMADGVDATPAAKCDQFLKLFSILYQQMERPSTSYYDWPGRAKKTLSSLTRSPLVQRRDFGQLYLRPYVDAEYPDSMSQLSVIAALHGYGEWRGRRVNLMDELSKGVGRFYDPKLKTLRRYLPNVGQDKDPDEVDAWYLYHPLKNLAILAQKGEAWAHELFFESIQFGIKAAKHFNYVWPIKYNLKTLKATEVERVEGGPGQTDVGGIYAYVMLQALELTGDRKYLTEAINAIDALKKYQFELLYQSNLTSLGLAACARLTEVTGDRTYIDQANVFLANLVHNSLAWRSQMGHAKDYEMFMGVSCLHNGPYMAAYECFESFGLLREFLVRGRDKVSAQARLIASESSKYALQRARYFFPDELPEDAVASDIRNGHIDRHLSIPLEDIYGDGRQAGSVGQEVYGAGMALVFCTQAFIPLRENRGFLFSEFPVSISQESESALTLAVDGSRNSTCRIALIGNGRKWSCDSGEQESSHSFQVRGESIINLSVES